jgi:hypothetical protein
MDWPLLERHYGRFYDHHRPKKRDPSERLPVGTLVAGSSIDDPGVGGVVGGSSIHLAGIGTVSW